MRTVPRIYDKDMVCLGELRTAKISNLKIKSVPLSTVTVTVPTAQLNGFGYRQFVELYDRSGKRIDMFRVARIPKKAYKPDGTVKLACDHVLCTLKDKIMPGYVQLGGSGQRLRAAVEAVLGYQTGTVRWVLDRCDFDTDYEYGLSDENLLSALLKLLEPLENWQIVTDTTALPWKLSVIRVDDEDASELRYSRNMSYIEETIDEEDFATVLYPRGYGEGVNTLTIRDANNGCEYLEAPQAVRDVFGVVERTYVDTTITEAKTLLAVGRSALAVMQTPKVSYSVKAHKISELTGEPMDAFYAGRIVRVIYVGFGVMIRTRVIDMEYPDPIRKPDEITLTLCSQRSDVATVIAQLAKQSRIQQSYGQGNTFIFCDSVEANADKDNPVESDIYIPDSMVHVNAVMLKVTLGAYRADSKGAAGGGSVSATTAGGGASERTSRAGGSNMQTLEQEIITTQAMTGGTIAGRDGDSSGNTGAARDSAGNTKTDTGSSGTLTSERSSILATFESASALVTGDAGSHTHTGPKHSHGMGHFHGVSGHTHTIDSHSHSGPEHYHTIDGHSHSRSAHSHSFSGSDSVGDHGHYHNINSPGTSSVTMGISRTITHNVGISGTTGDGGGSNTGSKSLNTNESGTGNTGGASLTTNSGGSTTTGQAAWSNGTNRTLTDESGNGDTSSAGNHNHKMASHTHPMEHTHNIAGHTHSMGHIHNFSHTHNVVCVVTIPSQTISIPSHSHTFELDDHTHDFTIPEHEHDIVYGIYKGPTAQAYVVEVDGRTVPASVFTDGIGDIAPYLSVDDGGKILRGVFHTLSVRPIATENNANGLCRIRASWNAQVFIAAHTGTQH